MTDAMPRRGGPTAHHGSNVGGRDTASSPQRPALSPEQAHDVRSIATSGIFDVAWYERQRSRSFATGHDAVRDFVLEGAALGLSAHPLFSHTWVTRFDSGPLDPVRVLVRYVNHPDFAQRVSTHPLFDIEALAPPLRNAPCPLAAFLATASDATPLPYEPEIVGALPGITLGDVTAHAAEALGRWTAGHGAPPGVLPESRFPAVDANRLTPGVKGRVSFVLVVRESADEFRQVHENLAGPRAVQAHGDWELLVVDPYEVDDARLVIESVAARDPRVRLVESPAPDLASALTAAASSAEARVIAFCDHRLVWSAGFTSALLAMIPGEHAVRSSAPEGIPHWSRASESVLPGLAVATNVLRRHLPLDPELGEACVVDLVHRIQEDIGPIPVLVGEDVSATVAEPIPRAADLVPELVATATNTWESGLEEPRSTHVGLTTLVIHDVAANSLTANLRSAAAFSQGRDVEVILTSHDESWQHSLLCSVLPLFSADATVVTGPANTGLLLNRALRRANGERLLVIEKTHTPAGDAAAWNDLLDEVASEGAAIHPLLVDNHDVVVDAGSFYPGSSSEPAALLRGVPRTAVAFESRTQVPGAELPLALRTDDVRAVGGFDPALDDVWFGNDLVRRLELALDAPARLATDVCVHTARAAGRWARKDRRELISRFSERWPEKPAAPDPLGEWQTTALARGTTAWSDPDQPDAWGRFEWVTGRRLEVTETPRRLQWLLLPRRSDTDLDTPAGPLDFASSLANGLRSLGQVAVVQDSRNGGYSIQPDVVLDLDGTADTPVPPGPLSVLWATDDVDRVDTHRLRGYDLAYAAAPVWARNISTREGLNVQPLLNCTDPSTFSYEPLSPFDRSPMTVVHSDRRRWRQRSVHASLQEIHRLGGNFRVHGRGWSGQIPPRFIGGEVTTAADLRELYRRAFYVTVDHRPELRELGLLSSQAFDVLACGGHLLTDDVAGLEELFGGHVAVYRNRLELAWAYSLQWVCYYPTPEGQERLAREVAEKHSFQARADTLVSAVLSTDSPPG